MRTSQRPPSSMLEQVDLGDTVTLPDGRELTVRAVQRHLPRPVGTMAGWLLAGEVGPHATLLSTPEHAHGPVVLYTPLDQVPAWARNAVPVFEGVVSYWAPHLPNVSGAMGELGWRVCEVRGRTEPLVLLWRGRELVVFVKSAVSVPDAFRCHFLPRDPGTTERSVARFSSLVRQPGHGATVPTEQHERVAQDLYRQFVTR